MITLFLYFAALIAYGASQTGCATNWQCKTCANKTYGCIDCFEGQGLSMEMDPSPNYICTDCGANCSSCINRTTCTQCNNGYGPIGSTNCYACITRDCLACPREVQTCTQCSPGYAFYIYGNACGKCSPYCQSGCDRRLPGNCDQCDPGYEYIGTTFVCGAITTATANTPTPFPTTTSTTTATSTSSTSGTTLIAPTATGSTVSGATPGSQPPTPTRATKSSVNPVTRNPGVTATKIQPNYGPMAGGTVITIVAFWTRQNVTLKAVYFGSHIEASSLSQLASSDYNNSSEVTVSVISPPISNISLINQPLLISFQVSPDLVNVSSGKFFTYKPNPTIDDVNPRTIPLSGGIRLIVNGSNLASASNPFIRAVVDIRRNGSLPSSNVSFGPCYQPNENGTQMTCLSPPIYIPQDFLLYLFGQTDQYSDVYRQRKRRDVLTIDWLKEQDTPLASRSRFKRSTDIFTNQTYVLPSTGDQMQVSMYADFDGLQVSLDNVRHLQVLNPPKIPCGNNIRFDSTDGGTITISGTGMRRCCGMADYTVRIGNGFCNVTGLTDNALTCEPPKDKPQQTDNDTLYCGENFAVSVNVGYKTYGCSCLTYIDNSKTTFIIIIATTVGSSLVIFVAIVVISICVKRSRTSEKPPTQEESIRNPWADRRRDVMMMMTSRQTNDIGSLKSNESDSTDLAPGGYYNRLPRPSYTRRPMNQSVGYDYQIQNNFGYVRPIEEE